MGFLRGATKSRDFHPLHGLIWQYGNMCCLVFKKGIENRVVFLAKNQHSQSQKVKKSKHLTFNAKFLCQNDMSVDLENKIVELQPFPKYKQIALRIQKRTKQTQDSILSVFRLFFERSCSSTIMFRDS